MQPELLAAAAAVSPQHFCERLKRGPRAPINEKVRVVNKLSAALLQFVHQSIFFVRIERLVEAAQLDQVIAPGNEVAKNEFLLAGHSPMADGCITSPTGPERKPTSQHQSEHLLQARRIRRATVGAAEHFNARICENADRTAQICPIGHRIVIKKINQFARGGAGGRVALYGGLFSSRHNDFEFFRWIIQSAAGRYRLDFILLGTGRDQDGNSWQTLVHQGRVESKL